VRKSLGHRSFGPCICCSTSPTSISRRSALSGISATAAVATASIFGRALPVLGETLPVEKTPLIHVHHHFAPPTYVAENRSRVSPAALDWTPQKALDAMDAEGVATAVLSLALPGVWFGDADAARRTSRLCNDYAADLARSHPGRFGLFPVVPLPDIEGSLREIEYGFDVLKASGIGIVTNYSDESGSKWLGNPAFTPVFEELDRRKAVVFVHPIVANCCQKLLPDVSPLVSEIPQDTPRAPSPTYFLPARSAASETFALSSRTAAVRRHFGRV
jgi:6-methylsalicylate decarboxylase